MTNGPEDYIATHDRPAWRDKADFIIAADISDANRRRWEQLWARKLPSGNFEICCIPFFVYDLALGDEVQVGPLRDRQYVVSRVVRQSGHYTFRIFLGDSPQGIAEQIERFLVRTPNVALEWASRHLLAVDAADERTAERISGVFLDEERKGHLEYETGRMS